MLPSPRHASPCNLTAFLLLPPPCRPGSRHPHCPPPAPAGCAWSDLSTPKICLDQCFTQTTSLCTTGLCNERGQGLPPSCPSGGLAVEHETPAQGGKKEREGSPTWKPQPSGAPVIGMAGPLLCGDRGCPSPAGSSSGHQCPPLSLRDLAEAQSP